MEKFLKENKLLYIDVETTGTDVKKCGIHQISGMIEIDGEIIETFDFKFKPFEGCVIEEAALSVTKTNIEDLNNRSLTEKEVHEKLTTILQKHVVKTEKKDKYFLIGYNVHFDKSFLHEFFIRCNDSFMMSYMWSNHIDVMVLATLPTMKYRKNMFDFKLMTTAKMFGININESKLHDALYDIELTREILYLIARGNVNFNITIEEVNGIHSLDYVINFGKHNGRTIKEVINIDKSYLIWANENVPKLKLSQHIINEINK